MQPLIETIVKALVDHPEDVRINEVTDERSVTYKLSVRQEDMGNVIGKKGRIAQAIRTVLNAAGSSENKRVFLDIEE
ncbi:MAG TPA: KH domain-containing protein [Bacillales bacterium]|nr:KH domain-containing protein [Bacillales bacterium]